MTNILIVDDEEKICEFIKAFLDNEGYYADVAYDGKSAIDKINSKKYDLIIVGAYATAIPFASSISSSTPALAGVHTPHERVSPHIRAGASRPPCGNIALYGH